MVKPLPEPFGFPAITRQRTDQALQAIKERKEYYTPGEAASAKPKSITASEDFPTPEDGQASSDPHETPAKDDDDPLGIF